MDKKRFFFIFALILVFSFPMTAQSHISLPLGDPVYHILEQAQMRGLCGILPVAKPYSRSYVLAVIEEILGNNSNAYRFGRLSENERAILEEYRRDMLPERNGLDGLRGTYSVDHTWNDVYFSGEFGFGANMLFAGGYYPDLEDSAWATDTGILLSFKGDLGFNTSYGFSLTGGLFKSPRRELGQYNTYYPGFNNAAYEPWYENRVITSYGEPLAFFPFTYKKKWDGSVW